VTEKQYGPCELIFDYRLPGKAPKAEVVASYGGLSVTNSGTAPEPKPGAWARSTSTFRLVDVPAAPLEIKATEGVEVMNVFVRELKEKK
jgi:hypothetical protein